MCQGLFNFKPSVRPVPLECHIQGYPGKFYCPRMATMNKPCYAAIQTHSPLKPVLVFVSSRRQVALPCPAVPCPACTLLHPSRSPCFGSEGADGFTGCFQCHRLHMQLPQVLPDS